MSIPVCIVAYKNPEAVARCLKGLPECAIPMVYDNTEVNIGLTAAANRLFRRATDETLELSRDAKYLLWLNQDVQLMPDTVDRAVAFMDANPRCAIGGFQQRSTDDPDFIIHGGTKQAWPAGVHLGGRASMGVCQESKTFGWVNMAGSIIRLDALNEIGPLDEQFFLVGQDSDICLRAWANGWQVWYIADAICLHDRGGASSSPSDEQIKIIQKDMAAWSRKWLPVLNGIAGADIPVPAAPET